METQKPKKFYSDQYLDGYELGGGVEPDIDSADISDDYTGPEPTDEELAIQDAEFQTFMEERGLWNTFQAMSASFRNGFNDGKKLQDSNDLD